MNCEPKFAKYRLLNHTLTVSFVKNKNRLLVKELDCEVQRPVNRTVSSQVFHQNIEKNCYFLLNRNTCRFDDFHQSNLGKNNPKYLFYTSKISILLFL